MGVAQFPAARAESGARMHKGITIALACGLISALLFTVGRTVSAAGLFASISVLPAMLVGLAYGTRSASVACLTGIFCVIMLATLFDGGLYGIVIAFPCWLIVRYALMNKKTSAGNVQWYPVGSALARVSLYGAMALTLAAIASFDPDGGFRETVERSLRALFSRTLALGSDPSAEILLQRTVDIFPGMFVAGWLMVLCLNAIFAQSLLFKRGLNARPTPIYSQMSAPEWLYWALVGAAILALLGDGNIEYLGRNLAIVFAAPFFFIGLGIVHVVVRRQALPGMAIIAFYFLLIISSWTLVAVVGLGFFEQWTALRQRYLPQPNDHEEES